VESRAQGRQRGAVPTAAWLQPTPGGKGQTVDVVRDAERVHVAVSRDGGIGDDAAD